MSWIHDGATTDALLSLSPSTNERFRELHHLLWSDEAADPVVLELCRLRMAQLIGSTADLAVRYEPARAAGLDEDKIEALGDWPVSDRYDERERAALNLAEKYVIDPHVVTDDDCARLAGHFSDRELATLTTALAVFDAMARYRVALGAAAPTDLAVDPIPGSPVP